MKYNDIALFKGKLKTNIQKWAEEKIDMLFPSKPQVRVFAKRGLDNLLSRHDARINKAIDTALLFVGDKDGTVDSDVAIETLAALFNEMDVRKYDIAGIGINVGKGAISIDFPHHFVYDMLVGNLGQVKITTDDLLELKGMFA